MNRLKIEDGKLLFYCEDDWVIADNVLFGGIPNELFEKPISLVVDFDIWIDYDILNKQEKLTLLEWLNLQVENNNDR
jgi:hypothetical protein